MATEIVMPRQGQSVEACTVVRWLKQPGERVAAGELLCEIETDKASFEVESTAAGTVLAHFAAEGEEVPVLAPIAAVGEPGEQAPAPGAPPAADRAAAAALSAAVPGAEAVPFARLHGIAGAEASSAVPAAVSGRGSGALRATARGLPVGPGRLSLRAPRRRAAQHVVANWRVLKRRPAGARPGRVLPHRRVRAAAPASWASTTPPCPAAGRTAASSNVTWWRPHRRGRS